MSKEKKLNFIKESARILNEMGGTLPEDDEEYYPDSSKLEDFVSEWEQKADRIRRRIERGWKGEYQKSGLVVMDQVVMLMIKELKELLEM